MPVVDRWGPPAPERLLTLATARLRGVTLAVSCAPCGRWRRIEGSRLPRTARSLTVGELWLAGRFRCSGCRQPATRVEVTRTDQTSVAVECWQLGDPLVAERLRRHWRHDPDDRRDWGAWFGR